jgi:uncharacterized coiled-coil DUF342 family protein
MYGLLLLCVAFAVFCFVRGMHFCALYYEQVTEVDNLRATVRELDNQHTEDLTAIDNLRFIVRQLEVERNGLSSGIKALDNSHCFLHKLYDQATKTIEMYRETISGLHQELTDKDEKIHMFQCRLDFYEPGDD